MSPLLYGYLRKLEGVNVGKIIENVVLFGTSGCWASPKPRRGGGPGPHDRVPDEVVDRVQRHVLSGMGLVVLHSGHHSRIFRRLLGTTCNLKWRDDARERLWTVKPNHPIAEGVPETFVLDREEMYGEPFDIAEPQETVFMGWFNGGEVFRSGCTWVRGNGKVFYFQPGHETNKGFQNEHVQRIIKNAVRWACPIRRVELACPHFEALEG